MTKDYVKIGMQTVLNTNIERIAGKSNFLKSYESTLSDKEAAILKIITLADESLKLVTSLKSR